MKILLSLGLMLPLLLSTAMAHENSDPLPRLKTVGNHLAKPDGTPVTLRGVSLCSLEWHKPLDQINQVTAGDQSWPVDVLRLPVQVKEWERYGGAKYMKEKLDPAVALCKAHHVYCIIDWHEIADWNNPGKIKELENFWRLVAIRYSHNPNIMYEIYNEPTNPKGMDRDNWLAWRDQMQQWIDQIRTDAPDTLLLIGSPHWSQMPTFAAQDPMKGDNLAYVMHLYPNFGPARWDKLFGDASKTIPIFISEWGWSSVESSKGVVFHGTQKEYAEPLRQYLTERPQISWTAWSYDPQCGPAMLGRDKEMGDFVQQWLTDARAGKN